MWNLGWSYTHGWETGEKHTTLLAVFLLLHQQVGADVFANSRQWSSGSPRPCYQTAVLHCHAALWKCQRSLNSAGSQSTTHRTSTEILKCCQLQKKKVATGGPNAPWDHKKRWLGKNGLATADKSHSHPLQKICCRVQVLDSGLVDATTRLWPDVTDTTKSKSAVEWSLQNMSYERPIDVLHNHPLSYFL